MAPGAADRAGGRSSGALLLAAAPQRLCRSTPDHPTPTCKPQTNHQASLALPGAITNAVRARLLAVPAGHVPLARLAQHALATASNGAASMTSSAAPSGAPAAGAGGGGAGGLQGPVLSQELHAHARALPLVVGCYLGNEGRLQVRGAAVCVCGRAAEFL